MTRQTTAPLQEFRSNVHAYGARELVHQLNDGWITVSAPYQRGLVWTYDQRVGLIRSWMTGLPIPALIINDRTSTEWTGPKPERELSAGRDDDPLMSVIDGKQRLLAAAAWFNSELPVPASWFPPEALNQTQTHTDDDGEYVTYNGLTRAWQLKTGHDWVVPVAMAKVDSVETEAAIYLLVNGAGVPQTDSDLTNAARVARGE